MNLHSWYFDLSLFTFGRHKKDKIKRMFEKWYPVIFITLLPPPFPLMKGNKKNPVPSPSIGHGVHTSYLITIIPQITPP